MNDLRKLAEKATSGPWTLRDNDEFDWYVASTANAPRCQVWTNRPVDAEPTAAYIAAANPTVILGLLDVVDAAREAASMGAVTARRGSVTRLRVALERLDARSSSKVETAAGDSSK